MTTETEARTSIWFKLAQAARLVFWLVLTGVVLLLVFGQRDTTQKARDRIFDQFQSERKSRVIALIHRQESRSILGVPVSSYINIEDSEAVVAVDAVSLLVTVPPDAAAVLARAVSRGLATPEQAARMSETDALEFIFEPGFSTAERISVISGRGVGMDVVKTTLQKLKGSIGIETHPGLGTTFQLRLPLTLAIIRAMLFRVGERLYAIPLESVLEIARASEADIHRVDSHEVLQLRNQVLTLVRLNRLAPAAGGHGDGRVFVIVVGSGERKFGLVVDKLVGEEELVIKPLDETIVASELVSGASILGDGTVVLILNVGEILRKFARARFNPASISAAVDGPSLEARA